MAFLNRRSFLQLAGLIGSATAVGYVPPLSATDNRSPAERALNSSFGRTGAVNLTPEQEAARFLAHATLGANRTLIEEVTQSGFQAWIDAQFALPPSQTMPLVEQSPTDPQEGFIHPFAFNWAYWQLLMTSPDLLRQRIAFALSEIFVISTRIDTIFDLPQGVSHYYDMLLKHAFGSVRDLLFDVTMHPCMGVYLSHARNRKSDPVLNRFPDENYAREVMQLFSIGLFELNQDGTHKLDGQGNSIPTYSNAQITEFAKVFTGLTFAPEDENEDENEIDLEYFLQSGETLHKPMIMYQPEHEPGEKHLLNGFVIPAGQTGMQDINDAVDNLFNHANMGPFLGRLLIQRLVKSNPSPAYISRVAGAFNDNGNGVRGDMQAVIRAILLDVEARDSSYISDPTHGMLREPFVRYVHLCRALNVSNQSGIYRNSGELAMEMLYQYPFDSPSVFNFFLPDYQPLGPLAEAGLVAPEFQITTSYTTISTINFMNNVIFDQEIMSLSPANAFACEQAQELGQVEDPPECEIDEQDIVFFDLEQEFSLAEQDLDLLIDHLDLVLTCGMLSPEMRPIIKNTLSALDNPEDQVFMALYLIMISPDYAILR